VIDREIREALSDLRLIRVREMHLSRLQALFDGEPLDSPVVVCGVGGWSGTDILTDPERWLEEVLESMAQYVDVALDDRVFRPLCLEGWLYGVHFTDRVFGAPVHFAFDQWWSVALETPVGQLPRPDLTTHETWVQARTLAELMVEAGCSAPLIATQVLGAPLNQTFNIYKDRLLEAFYDDPDGVKRDLRVVTDTLCAMHRWYRQHIPRMQMQPVCIGGRCQPRGFGQMCGCATQLVSPRIYREFIAPLDDEVLSLYPHGGMYHLCGSHTHLIPTWREMKSLRAIQINDRAAEDLEEYYRELRDDQVIYLNPTETMTVERAMAITGGRRLVIAADLKAPPRSR
jgi:hypothetical protein